MTWVFLLALTLADDLPVRLRAIDLRDPPAVAPAVVWPPWTSGRLVTRPRFHLGVRPHALATAHELAMAVTVQVRFEIHTATGHQTTASKEK